MSTDDQQDTGTEDHGTEDHGTEDTGTEDHGTEDHGTEDTGTEDTGTEDDDDDDDDQQDDGDTFPRPYVERLRARSAGYRARAKDAEARAGELERALFTERVARLDVLADPTDLPYDAELLEDPDALTEAVQQLVRDRPHYRRRGTLDGAGTGSRDRAGTSDGVSLAAIMRGQA